MEDFEKKEYELYISRYGLPQSGNYWELWKEIKGNKELLEWAIKPVKDKTGEHDLVNGMAICDGMLADYESIDPEIYKKLIQLVYSNEDIARIDLGKLIYRGGNLSYLLMALWNFNVELTEEQKNFAVKEVFSNGHGRGDFDIRYWILRNPNWSLEEKQKLLMEFWTEDEYEEYDEALEQWEWNIVNDPENYKQHTEGLIDQAFLYEYNYDFLLTLYQDKETANRIWDEIQFCKQMHSLRPQQWELEYQDEGKKSK